MKTGRAELGASVFLRDRFLFLREQSEDRHAIRGAYKHAAIGNHGRDVFVANKVVAA